MLYVVMLLNVYRFEVELDEMFELWQKVFFVYFNWYVFVDYVCEKDEFDDGNVIYLMCKYQGLIVGVIWFVYFMLLMILFEVFFFLFIWWGVF